MWQTGRDEERSPADVCYHRCVVDVDISPPPGLNMPLWRSLILNLADRISPQRLPPLELTSTPVNTGMLFGDRLALPWYRTVFANISDVVSPDMGPPLDLTAKPVDVGELLGDELSHNWWSSLFDGLRDRLSPDQLPPLQLTSKPMAAYGANAWLLVMDWSNLLTTPKVFLKDPAPEVRAANPAVVPEVVVVPTPAPVKTAQELWAAQMQFKRDLSRSRFRQKIWMSLVAAEVIMLLSYVVHFK